MRGGYSGVATFCRAASCVPVAALDGFTGACTLCLSKRFTRPMHCMATILVLACYHTSVQGSDTYAPCIAWPARRAHDHAKPVCWASWPLRGAAGSQARLLCAGLLSQSQAKPKDLPPSTPAQEALSNPCSELFERLVTPLGIASPPDDGSHNACRVLGCVVLDHNGSLLMPEGHLHPVSVQQLGGNGQLCVIVSQYSACLACTHTLTTAPYTLLPCS